MPNEALCRHPRTDAYRSASTMFTLHNCDLSKYFAAYDELATFTPS